jgi:phage FluMu protein gp41
MKIRRRRFAALTVAQTKDVVKPRTGKCNYPIGARFCKANAGARTAHPGTGYCAEHDNKGYDPIHRYRGLKQHSIASKMEKLNGIEQNVFDLVPEIQLLRGMLMDYIERFYEFQEALHAWHFEVGTRPKTAMDIIEVSKLIESVSRLIERHHRIESKESISLETFRRVTEAMGIIVAKHVRSGNILEAIEKDWSTLSLESRNSLAIPASESSTRMIGDGEETDS